MKLNNTIKIALTTVFVALLVDMWRNWPWTKAIFLKAQETIKD